MTEPHDGTAHVDGPDHFRLTCSCGWELDPVPNNWDRWAGLLEQHRADPMTRPAHRTATHDDEGTGR